MESVKPLDFPVLLFLAGMAFEFIRYIASPERKQSQAFRLATYFMRPWTFWALFNFIFRLRIDDAFNRPETFPFFANPWVVNETWRAAFHRLNTPEFWLWSAALLVSAAATAALVRRFWAPGFSRVAGVTILLGLGILLPLNFAAIPGGVTRAVTERDAMLRPWFITGGTMLHCMPFVKSTTHYLSNYELIQPRLVISMHGLTHPPFASLSLHWLGRLTGAGGERLTVESDRWHYAMALTCFNALAVLAMVFLGTALFGDARIGWLSGLFWLIKPAALAHNTFAQDGVYSVFFILALALGWQVITLKRPPRLRILLLGGVFFVLSQLTFSWCIMTSIFAAFAAFRGKVERWTLRSWMERLIAPLAVFAVLLFGFCAYYKLDYLAVYKTASDYVNRFYAFQHAYHWIMALIGGQLSIILMLGSVVGSFFLVRILPLWRRTDDPAVQYALTALVFYLIPVLFGPTCLKMETDRCWAWMTAIPLAFVAREVAKQETPRLALVFVALNLFQYYLMRLCICVLS